MKLAFVRRYNVAYDQFLIRYFNQGGIEFSHDTTFEEVKPRGILSESMVNPSSQERLFRAYVSNWRMHPEARPCYYELFDEAIGGTGQPDFAKLKALEPRLEDHTAKLLFSTQDVAQTISDYYKRFVRDPLRQELEDGHGGREILKYFTSRELRAPPFGAADVDTENREAVWNEAAGKLVLWFDSITPQRVESEIQGVFVEHEADDLHINAPDLRMRPEDQHWWCSHESALVRLSTYREPTQTRPSMRLAPTRGYDAAEHVIGPGWDIVAFPEFWVADTE
jgi:hypothetical protein